MKNATLLYLLTSVWLITSCQYFDEKPLIQVRKSVSKHYIKTNRKTATDNFSKNDIFEFEVYEVTDRDTVVDTTLLTENVHISVKGSKLKINKMRFITSKVGFHTIYGHYNDSIVDSINVEVIGRPNPDRTPNYILLEQFIENNARYIRSFYNAKLVKEHIKNFVPIRYFYINDNDWYTEEAKQAETVINDGTALSDEWKGIYMRNGSWNLNFDTIVNDITSSYNPFIVSLESSVSQKGIATVKYQISVKLSINVPVKIEALLTHRPEKYTQQNIPDDPDISAFFGNEKKVEVNPEYVYIKHFGNVCDPRGYKNCKTTHIDPLSRSVDTLSSKETSDNFVIRGQFQTDVSSAVQDYSENLYVIMIIRDIPSRQRRVQDIQSIRLVKLGENTL